MGTLERAMTFNPISLESFDGTNGVILYPTSHVVD
jgi:hypothetical protein